LKGTTGNERRQNEAPATPAPSSGNWYSNAVEAASSDEEDAELYGCEGLEGPSKEEPFDWGLLYPQLQEDDSTSGSQHSPAGPSAVGEKDTSTIAEPISSTPTTSTPASSTPASSIPTSTLTGPSLGDLLKNTFPHLANGTTKHPHPEPANSWEDGIFHGFSDATSSSPSPTPSPTSEASDSFPLLMGPGPYVPEGVSMSWPHLHPQRHPSASSTIDNLESMPTVTNDLTPEDEDAVRKFFEDLSHASSLPEKRQLSPAPASLILSTSDDIPSLLSPPSPADQSPQEQCAVARQTLQKRLKTYRSQFSEPCGLGKVVQVPVPPMKEMQDAMEQVCWLKREGVSKA
jgi:hypothetical protein